MIYLEDNRIEYGTLAAQLHHAAGLLYCDDCTFWTRHTDTGRLEYYTTQPRYRPFYFPPVKDAHGRQEANMLYTIRLQPTHITLRVISKRDVRDLLNRHGIDRSLSISCCTCDSIILRPDQ